MYPRTALTVVDTSGHNSGQNFREYGMYGNSRNPKDAACTHVSPVVVNPVGGGGWKAHCLGCGRLGPVSADSVEALHALQGVREDHEVQYRATAFGNQASGTEGGAIPGADS